MKESGLMIEIWLTTLKSFDSVNVGVYFPFMLTISLIEALTVCFSTSSLALTLISKFLLSRTSMYLLLRSKWMLMLFPMWMIFLSSSKIWALIWYTWPLIKLQTLSNFSRSTEVLAKRSNGFSSQSAASNSLM